MLNELYRKNFLTVQSFVIANNGSTEQAEDIYQEAFVAVWRKIQLEKFQPEDDKSFSAYLVRVAKNKWIDHLRSKQFKVTVAFEAEKYHDYTEEILPEENEYLNIVRIHFEELGDSCKDLLSRFYFKKDSLRKIAVYFKWTEATARNNKYRCLQKLRNLINQRKP